MLLAVSVFSAWQPIENPWRQPWLFQWMEAYGWIDYSEERPKLDRSQWTWFSSVPEPAADGMAWVEFEIARPGIASRYVRLLVRGTSQVPPADQVEVEIRETANDGITPPRTRTVSIDRKKFHERAMPSDFLRWTDPSVTRARQLEDLAFVRGVPLLVPYELRVMRYLKSQLRPEAIYCRQVAAHVAFAAEEDDPKLTYRCDSWLTDEVPFGVAQVEFHISPRDGSGILFHERWTLHDCSPRLAPYKPATIELNVE